MVDLSKTIKAKSDQLNADDLIGNTITIKITKVSETGSEDQPIAISYDGDNGKPWKPCKSMRRVLVHIWGKDGAAFVGRKLQLHRDANVTWGGAAVGGVRITHASNIQAKMTLAVTEKRGSKKPFVVNVLADNPDPKAFDTTIPSKVDVAQDLKVWSRQLAEGIKASANEAMIEDWLRLNPEAMNLLTGTIKTRMDEVIQQKREQFTPCEEGEIECQA